MSLSDYKFRIEAIYDNLDARAAFLDYLKGSSTAEPLQLFIAADEYYQLRLDKNRYQKAKEIMSQFIVPNAPNELNLAGTIRKQVMDQFALIEQQHQAQLHKGEEEDLVCPRNLFEVVQDNCFFELKEDSFPRFIKSDHFQKLVAREQKKDVGFLSKIGARRSMILSNGLHNQSFVGVDDHNVLMLCDSENNISEYDVQMALKLVGEVDDRIWEAVKGENDRQMYCTKDLVHFQADPNSTTKAIRTEVLLQADLSTVVYYFMDTSGGRSIDKFVGAAHLVEYREEYNNEKIPYACSITLSNAKFPLIASREILTAATWIPRKYNAERKDFDQYLFITKSVDHPDHPPPKGKRSLSTVRADMYRVQMFERIAPNITQMTLVFAMNPRGFISRKILVKIVAKQRKGIIEAMSHDLNEKKKNIRVPINSNGMVDAIKSYISRNREEFKEGTPFD